MTPLFAFWKARRKRAGKLARPKAETCCSKEKGTSPGRAPPPLPGRVAPRAKSPPAPSRLPWPSRPMSRVASPLPGRPRAQVAREPNRPATPPYLTLPPTGFHPTPFTNTAPLHRRPSASPQKPFGLKQTRLFFETVILSCEAVLVFLLIQSICFSGNL